MLRRKAMAANREFNALAKPLLDDYSLLGGLFQVCTDMLADRTGWRSNPYKVYNRKKFLMVVLYLYSPKTLVGGKMRGGLRNRLSDVFEMNSRTVVSDNCGDVWYLFSIYADFRADVMLFYRLASDFIAQSCKG